MAHGRRQGGYAPCHSSAVNPPVECRCQACKLFGRCRRGCDACSDGGGRVQRVEIFLSGRTGGRNRAGFARSSASIRCPNSSSWPTPGVRSAPAVPFLTHAWAVAWWHHYQQQSGELFTLAVRDAAGRLIGLAPWHRQISAGRGRVVRFLGSGEVCADYVSLVAQPEDRLAVAVAIADWLAGPGAGEWDVLEMSGVERDR